MIHFYFHLNISISKEKDFQRMMERKLIQAKLQHSNKTHAIRIILRSIFTAHFMFAIIIIKFNKIHYVYISKLDKLKTGKCKFLHVRHASSSSFLILSCFEWCAFSHSFSFLLFLQMHKTFYHLLFSLFAYLNF